MKSIILYTTRYGNTAEAAKRIQKSLGGECRLVNLTAESAPSLDGYDTVILGGSVYIGKVQKQLTSYIQANLKQLLSKNVGLYLCAGAQKEEEREQELNANFPQELLSHARAKDILGYAYAFDKMRFLDKVIMKKIKGDSISVEEFFDDKLAAFAKALAK